MATQAKLFPNLKWAQRKDRILLTIEVADVENHKIDLTPEGKLSFQGESHGSTYGFEFQLFDEISVEDSKWDTKGRNIILNIVKKNQDKEYWPRLTSDKAKNPHILFDWAKWVDEDEEQEEESKGMTQDWNPENMNNFNMGDYGQGGDSDDEEEEEEEEKQEEPATTKPNADLGDLDAEVEDKNTAAKTE